jgi:outer membrane protein assembly factor BamB
MASEIKLEKEGSLTFVGSPVVTRQGVFLMARKLDNANFTQQFLVRLDRETGEPTWSCYLCSTNNQLMSGNPAIPVPTLVDDVLYISTGQGADCAVDANAGRILWLRPTITQQPGLVAGGRIMVTTIQPGASWKYNPPVVVGEYVLTTDTGQMLRIYGRWNGRLVKAIPAADLVPSFSGGVTAIDVLAGAIGTKVVMSIGSMSVCYDIASLLEKTPQPFWTSAVAGAGSPQGRPFLTEAGYYVPFSSKLVRIDTRSGKSEQWEWPKNDKDENGKPGNLLVTSEQVIVVNDVEVAGYSKWETARDNRLARIAANPNDPEPYLALAEVAFRTNHAEMAQSNMKKAVDMTNAGGTPASQSNADFLGRLYRTNLSFGLQLFGKSDSALWAQTRFFLEQCRATARQPEQQAEWRMRLANLSLEEKKPEEAIALYTEVLTDPALRASLYRDEKDNQSAGSTAEQRIKSVIAGRGVEVYKRSEDQAAALANRGTAAKDAAVLQQVVDGYPNSAAALSAAMTLADLYQQKQDWKNARRALFWLQPRAQGTAQAKAIADLVAVNIALKKFSTASDFAARGMRMYKDYTWNDGGKPVSFTDLKKKVAALGGAELDGSLPLLHATPGAPELESPKEGPLARKEKELISFLDPIVLDNQVKSLQLLAPVETTPGLRPSNLLFMRNADKLIIRDTAKGVDLKANVALSQNTDTVLLGATRDNAVLLQRDRIIGVDLKSYATWNVALRNVPGGPPPAGGGRAGVVRGGARVMVRPGAQVQVIGGVVVVDGSQVGPVEMVTLIDENGNPYPLNASTDPDQARHAAFAVLGNQLRFTSARMLNGNVYILAGNEMSAYDAKTGKPSWPAATVISGATPVGFLANEDMVLVQADDASGRQSIFYAIDAQSGKLRKTLKLESDAGPEHAIWRGLGDDGTLYVITDRSTAAYDMVTDLAGAIWRKTDIGSRFAGAAALTLDGLIAVNDEHEVTCLSLESGEKRWKAGLKLELIANAGISALRSTVEGDVVVFQSQDGSAAYLTYPSPDPDRQLAWLAAKTQESISRNSLQMSDTLVVELLQGPLPQKTSVGTNIILRDRKGGRLYTDQPVITSRNWAVRSWQVVDGGIAFELLPGNGNVAGGNNVTGNIYLWKSTK